MYVLTLVFLLSGDQKSYEIIGAFNSLSKCESASLSNSSSTKCFHLDPDKGIMEIYPSGTSQEKPREDIY